MTTTKLLTALVAAGMLAAGVTSVATAAPGDGQITVGPQIVKPAGEVSPFDAAGVPAVRRGKPIPKGYVLVGRRVTIDRGTSGAVGAALKLRCPAGKTARTLGTSGANGPALIGDRYVGHRDVRVAVWSPPRAPRSTGVSYVVCS